MEKVEVNNPNDEDNREIPYFDGHVKIVRIINVVYDVNIKENTLAPHFWFLFDCCSSLH